MSEADKQTVMDTRKKNKAKGFTSGKKKSGDLKSQIAELKRSIASMQSVPSESDSGRSEDPDVPDNAGDAFFGGGVRRRSRKRNDNCRPFPQLNSVPYARSNSLCFIFIFLKLEGK